MKEEVDRRRKPALAAFGPLKGATDQLTDPKLHANLFVSTVLQHFVMRRRRGLVLRLQPTITNDQRLRANHEQYYCKRLSRRALEDVF
ncbi:hypothetical protein KIN20_024906 [Parelaphostrongylus tenuis]|uniref:Uncharacterized protein n=1 Tax=Parelaphostrongylus tenuis TaxID=148309 RepID=A0AAD5QXP3_PARTN|nr:hypothetical protein KIN20_024906 [Parelaphostrongylus tenuis]